MSRILLDHSVPRGLRALLTGFEVKHAYEMSWHELRNGELLETAERAGFAALITADKNLRYQNRLERRTIAIVELGTNHWPTLESQAGRILEALRCLSVGAYSEVTMPKPPRRKRPISGPE